MPRMMTEQEFDRIRAFPDYAAFCEYYRPTKVTVTTETLTEAEWLEAVGEFPETAEFHSEDVKFAINHYKGLGLPVGGVRDAVQRHFIDHLALRDEGKPGQYDRIGHSLALQDPPRKRRSMPEPERKSDPEPPAEG